ncbi:DNA primase [archaeon]|nr:MAG: DNA primase [archaeon]
MMNSKRDETTKPTVLKYECVFDLFVSGVVERSDVIGAIFGQLEGLLGPELELRELQKTGKIGRIEVDIKRSRNGVQGIIRFESGLNKAETALLAAAFETVIKIGPYDAEVKLKDMRDLREERRKWIVQRAMDILKQWQVKSEVSFQEMVNRLNEMLASSEVTYYGPERLVCGPDLLKSDEIIIVEGRADVLNLLRYGWRNAIATGGAKVPKSIIELSKKKVTIAFVDGDRGGELLLNALLDSADIDYVARAPENKGVEELTAKEILSSLRNAVSADEYKRKSMEQQVKIQSQPDKVKQAYDKVKGTDKVLILNKDMKVLIETTIKDLLSSLQQVQGGFYLIYDGNITQRVLDLASSKGIKTIVAKKVHEVIRYPPDVRIVTME